LDKATRSRARPIRSTENIAVVAQSVLEQPSTSTGHRSQNLNISRTSLRRILNKDFSMKPYKVQLVQELKPHDHPMRFRFAQWAEQRLVENEHFYRKIIFFDEAHFHLGGYEQAELSYLGVRESARRHGEADASTTSNCLVWFLVRQHHWAIFLRK